MAHILRSSPTSPFGRKVKLSAYVSDLMSEIEVVQANTADPEDSLRAQNPLGKIPALILENGPTLYDSRVIVEWLDTEARARGRQGVIPQEHDKRFAALTLQSLADGIMDAAILQVYEKRMRPESHQYQGWVDHQAGKVSRALAEAEKNASAPIMTGKINIGQIALACALEYLDLRFAEMNWRAHYPNLAAWLEGFCNTLPQMASTRFTG